MRADLVNGRSTLASAVRRTTSLAAIAIVAACGSKVDLGNAKQVYARWELGWLEAKPCLFGTIERTVDPRLQVELAQLFNERPSCPSWLLDNTEKLPGLSVSQLNKKAREKELDDKANAINVWTLLEASDLTDELADDAVELVKAVKAYQALPSRSFDDKHVDAIVALANARQKLRGHLGLPPDATSVSRDTPVMVLAPRPVAPLPPPPFDAALAEKWKGAAKDVAGWSAPYALADKTEPIVWIMRGDADDGEIRVFQLIDGKWKETKLSHVAYVMNTPKRLDVVYRPKAPEGSELQSGNASWIWFGPGRHDPEESKLINWGDIYWMCSSESFLWLSTGKDGVSKLGRMRLGTDQLAETVETMGAGGGQCDDNAVSTEIGKLCTMAAGCKPSTISGQLLDGQIVGVIAGPVTKDGQLLIMRTSARKERVLRLPPGSVYAGLSIRDRKPVISLAAKTDLVVSPDPGGSEPKDYQCGGNDRVVPRVGCKCPAGFKSARTAANVAICAPGDGKSAGDEGTTGPKEVVLPWPLT
jgi:hypothetical protein